MRGVSDVCKLSETNKLTNSSRGEFRGARAATQWPVAARAAKQLAKHYGRELGRELGADLGRVVAFPSFSLRNLCET